MDKAIAKRRGAFLSKNKMALYLHKELVRGGYLLDEDFWFGIDREMEIEEILSAQESPNGNAHGGLLETKGNVVFSNVFKQRVVEIEMELIKKNPAFSFSEESDELAEKINTHSINIAKMFCKEDLSEERWKEESPVERKEKVRVEFSLNAEEEGIDSGSPTPKAKEASKVFYEILKFFWCSKNDCIYRFERFYNCLMLFYKKKKDSCEGFSFLCNEQMQAARCEFSRRMCMKTGSGGVLP
eukprot:GHVN01083847.1.p1 GENE.GHVN01083847.1~~GHVN01083847.1.p1  ORF type:complete len:241 (+),score=40.45 GHVN01083847.1:380-1102(+)